MLPFYNLRPTALLSPMSAHTAGKLPLIALLLLNRLVALLHIPMVAHRLMPIDKAVRVGVVQLKACTWWSSVKTSASSRNDASDLYTDSNSVFCLTCYDVTHEGVTFDLGQFQSR